MRSSSFLGGLLIIAVALAGCTPSTGEYQSGGGAWRPGLSAPGSVKSPLADSENSEVTVSGPGADAGLIDAFLAANPEFGGSVHVTASGGDVQLGLAEGVEYGRDVVCLVGNQSWFAANMLDFPEGAREAAPWLSIDEPSGSPETSLWLAGRAQGEPKQLKKNLKKLTGWGAEVSWLTGGASQDPGPRVFVGSALYPWLEANNLGTDSQWRIVPKTCVTSGLFVASESEAGQVFVQYLTSERGQSDLAQLGIAYPVDAGVIPEAVADLAPEPKRAKNIPPEERGAWVDAVNTTTESLAEAQSD